MNLTKRLYLTLLSVCLLASIAFAQNENTFFHRIKKGESLYSISKMYNVSTEEIIQLNPGSDAKIYVGDVLRIPQKAQEDGFLFHTINAGETLYRLSVKYNISTKVICDANPGLSAENFRIGQVVRIPIPKVETKTSTSEITPKKEEPKCRLMHRIKRRDKIKKICKKYDITPEQLLEANPKIKDEGLKKGRYLCIPFKKEEASVEKKKEETLPEENIVITKNIPITNEEAFLSSEKERAMAKSYERIKAALIMPFTQDKRMVEYYEGLLVAVDSLKHMGVSIDLYAYNCLNSKPTFDSIMAKPELKEMNLILGHVNNRFTEELAQFTQAHNIKFVVPFYKVNEVFNYPNLYQINTPQSYLYSEVYDHFVRQFAKSNVIFVQPTMKDERKAEFINGFKTVLYENGNGVHTISENATHEELRAVLDSVQHNIFIPTTGNNLILTKIIPQLTFLKRQLEKEYNEYIENINDPKSDVVYDAPVKTYSIKLFGYPEWQTYTDEHLQNFFELDTHFYTSFYTNNLFPEAVKFTKLYQKWYKKALPISYPQYAMLGFDTGFFFLKGLYQYGDDFNKHLTHFDLDIRPIQTEFNFKRVNNWGGFINKEIFFIEFTNDYNLIKLNFD